MNNLSLLNGLMLEKKIPERTKILYFCADFTYFAKASLPGKQ